MYGSDLLVKTTPPRTSVSMDPPFALPYSHEGLIEARLLGAFVRVLLARPRMTSRMRSATAATGVGAHRARRVRRSVHGFGAVSPERISEPCVFDNVHVVPHPGELRWGEAFHAAETVKVPAAPLVVVVGHAVCVHSLHVFVRCLVDCNEVEVVEVEAEEADEHDEAVKAQEPRRNHLHVLKLERHVVRGGQVRLDEERRGRREGHVQQGHGSEEQDEHRVVSPADAVPHPRAVVVEAVNAVVAVRAVLRARGALNVARRAVLGDLPVGRLRLVVVEVRLPLPFVEVTRPSLRKGAVVAVALFRAHGSPQNDAGVEECRAPEEHHAHQGERDEHDGV
mmetsp:Transcript_87229/g.168992  ORF Transcript_87229/g.168992 Transcript_87229/m.168992 type:complete len:337 (+) Transcript_87229:283-1293(+)